MSELHLQAMEIAKQYKKCEGDLLSILEKIQTTKTFVGQGYSSLFEYIVKGLGLSESTAYSFHVVLRKSQEVPQLKSLVISGEISLCKARRIAPVINRSSAIQWLTIAKQSTVREIDRQVALTHPQVIQEKITAKSEDRSELKIGISPSFEEKLGRVQDLLSNQLRQTVSRERALEAALDEILEKFSARRKIRVKTRVSSHNRTLTAKTKQIILARDQDHCTYVNERGERCQSRRFLDIHHLRPRSQGGTHTPENLLTLCSTHHGWIHRRNENTSSTSIPF